MFRGEISSEETTFLYTRQHVILELKAYGEFSCKISRRHFSSRLLLLVIEASFYTLHLSCLVFFQRLFHSSPLSLFLPLSLSIHSGVKLDKNFHGLR